MTNAEYHSIDGRVSFSMLKAFEASRRDYHAMFVERSLEKPPPTKDMAIGSMVHSLVLEPDRVDAEFAVAPECDRRTKAGKELWAEFVLDSAGKQVLDAASADVARRCADAVLNDERARKVLDQLEAVEQSIYWDDTAGIERKARCDGLGPVGFELKTTAGGVDPKSAAREIANRNYHRQIRYYMDGFGERPWVICFVAKTERPSVACYTLTAKALTLGTDENRRSLEALAECYATGDWREPWQKVLTELDLPAWAYFESDWRL